MDDMRVPGRTEKLKAVVKSWTLGGQKDVRVAAACTSCPARPDEDPCACVLLAAPRRVTGIARTKIFAAEGGSAPAREGNRLALRARTLPAFISSGCGQRDEGCAYDER